MNKKKLSMAVAAAAVAMGTAIGVAVAGGTAHAQSSSSISITGMTQAGPAGNPDPEMVVSVTCPAGAYAEVNVTAQQGYFFTGLVDSFKCNGSPQNEVAGLVPISGEYGSMFAGPVSAGAALTVSSGLSQDVGTTATVTYP
jgi:hypothetical protein